MKKWWALITGIIIPVFFLYSQQAAPAGQSLRTIKNDAFKVNEYLKYRIHYGIIDAGVAELRITEVTTRQGRPVYHMVGTGRTVGMAEWFFRTRDRYETYIDTRAIIPWEFIRDVDEGGYIIKRHIIFDHYKDKAVDLDAGGKTFRIADNAQDLLSSFYYARTFNIDTLKVGDEIPVDMFLDHEMFVFRLRYLGKEMVETPFGEVRCLKLQPLVQSGRVFEEKEGMTLWVTDDANKIPVRMESELVVGSIKVDLIDYKNVKHPIAFRN